MRSFWKAVLAKRGRLTWGTAKDYGLIATGALLQALAIRLFLVPAGLVIGQAQEALGEGFFPFKR
jgi:hypothetical protein